MAFAFENEVIVSAHSKGKNKNQKVKKREKKIFLQIGITPVIPATPSQSCAFSVPPLSYGDHIFMRCFPNLFQRIAFVRGD